MANKMLTMIFLISSCNKIGSKIGNKGSIPTKESRKEKSKISSAESRAESWDKLFNENLLLDFEKVKLKEALILFPMLYAKMFDSALSERNFKVVNRIMELDISCSKRSTNITQFNDGQYTKCSAKDRLMDFYFGSFRDFLEKKDFSYNISEEGESEKYNIQYLDYLWGSGTSNNKLLLWASYNGKIDIVKEIILQKDNFSDFNSAMVAGAIGNHLDVIKLMLARVKGIEVSKRDGYRDSFKKQALNLNEVMRVAAVCGFIDILNEMLKEGADNIDYAMEEGAMNGHLDVLKLMVANGGKSFDKSLLFGAQGGYEDVVLEMIKGGAIVDEYILYTAAISGNINILRMVLESYLPPKLFLIIYETEIKLILDLKYISPPNGPDGY